MRAALAAVAWEHPVDSPAACRHWRPLVPERAGIAIENIDVFAGYCLLQERHDGRPALSILSLPPPDAPGQGVQPTPLIWAWPSGLMLFDPYASR